MGEGIGLKEIEGVIATCRRTAQDTELEAILGSIKKWDCIAQGIGVDAGTTNCPLCMWYFYDYEGGCTQCPVAIKVHKNCCKRTPYMGILLGLFSTIPEYIRCPTVSFASILITLDAIEAEIEFLISLLPKDHTLREI